MSDTPKSAADANPSASAPSCCTRLWGVPGLLACLVVLFDQLTKWLIDANCPVGWQKEILSGYFSLVHVRNTGAAWGIFADRTWLLGLVSLAACILVAVFFDKFTLRRPFPSLVMGVIYGGIFGNLIDRFLRRSVIDFLDFYWHGHHWPAFNVADCAITCGITLLVIWNLFFSEKPDGVSDVSRG
jgi:signal peptidase II